MTDTIEEVKHPLAGVTKSADRLSIVNHTRMTTTHPSCTLTHSDLESVERIVYKTADDISVSIARSFERMEERMDAMEARLYSRFSDLEDLLTEIRIEATKRPTT